MKKVPDLQELDLPFKITAPPLLHGSLEKGKLDDSRAEVKGGCSRALCIFNQSQTNRISRLKVNCVFHEAIQMPMYDTNGREQGVETQTTTRL